MIGKGATLLNRCKSALSLRFIEGLPLLAFLIYSRMIDRSMSIAWLGPYLLATLLSLFVMGIFIFKKQIMNRCFLGINTYFVLGSLGLLLGWLEWNALLGKLEASGMLLVIILFGALATVFSPSGFVGVETKNKGTLHRFSLMLLAIASCSFFLSWYFSGSVILAEIIPFTVLFMSLGRFRAILEKGEA